MCFAQDSASKSDRPGRTSFTVRYVNGSDVYIDGGRAAGLSQGMILVLPQSTHDASGTLKDRPIEPGIVARLRVVAVASTSAVCSVTASSRALVRGDVVTLPEAEVEKMVQQKALSNTRSYPIIISFTDGNPLDEDVREDVPRPPLPEVNMARGRVGFDISTIRALGQGNSVSTMYGMVARADISRIFGTHWNLDGYWRGQFQSSSGPTQTTIQDLINRTYQMSLTYINPQSSWTAGVGRLYLPWASSLEVIDGFYVARNLSDHTLSGVFAGSTPDPTAWNYNPDRRIGGIFFNAHGGDFDHVRFSTTAGGGVATIKWNIDRPFVFTETDFSWKRYISVYHAMQIDKPTPNPGTPAVSAGIGQSFLSAQFRFIPRTSIEANDTYFRDVPTFDANLIGTGLLDQYLFQGFTLGARVNLPFHFTPYFTGGRSSTSTDKQKSWNLQGGLALSRIWKTGVTVDGRYSQFNSDYASGTYKTLTVIRSIGERLQLNMQGGRYNFTSALTTNTASWFGNAWLDTTLGRNYFLEGGYTTQRGGTQNYDQYTFTFGYRFNNRSQLRRLTHAAH